MKNSNLLLFTFFILVCFFSSVKLDAIESRGIVQEPVIFEVQVNAQCESYVSKALSSIQISRFISPGCLPISSVDPKLDVNDRHSHIFCTNLDGGRSLFRFHEIFSIEEDETPIPGEIFIVSWSIDFPFIESTRKYTYLRRPTCAVKTDLCTSTQIVDYCNDNTVIYNRRNGFVSTSDRVYFIPPGITVDTCLSNSTCCPYVSTLVSGICGGTNAGDLCANVTCNDNNNCTTDTCNPSNGQCVYTPITCNDNLRCTNDSCDPSNGQCVFTPIICDDNLRCTNDSCDSSNGQCVFTPIICNDNNVSTSDSCDPSNGQCIFDPIICNDNNSCTTDVFNTTSLQCDFTPIICNDNLNCTTDTCNASNGQCVFDPIVCNDNSACTNDSCNPANGQCVFIPIICDDRINCTRNLCNNITGCFYPQKDCSDGKACTANYCDEANGGNCIETNFCNDGIPCTSDRCNEPCPPPPQSIPCILDQTDNSQNATFKALYCQYTDICTSGTCDLQKGCCSTDPNCF